MKNVRILNYESYKCAPRFSISIFSYLDLMQHETLQCLLKRSSSSCLLQRSKIVSSEVFSFVFHRRMQHKQC